jgi:choline dehydrogenase-like flavoprotein
VLHANVVELESDRDARRVERVHVKTLAGRRFTVAAREYVLASGALENARLLLSSDRHRPRGLGNDHDVVGRYFLEHPRFRAATLQPANAVFETRFYDQHLVGGEDVEGYLALEDATQRANEMLDVQLKLRAVLDGAYAEIDDAEDVVSLRALIGQRLVRDQVSPRPSVDVANVIGDLMTWHHSALPGAPLPVPHPDVLAEVARASPVERRALLPGLLGEMAGYAYEKLLGSAPVKGVDVTARMTPVPNRESRVTLSRERDALGMRRIDLDWQLSRFDRENLLRTLDRFGAAVGAAGKGRLRVLVGGDGPWPSDLAGGWHQMGTTRMSNDPRKGVVDRDCRVHGIANLYVAGSSVFPTAGSGTPTLTLTALALRLGRHLGGVLR